MSRSLATILLLSAALAAFPVSQSQDETAEDPHVSDPANDQGPPGPATRHFDLLRAWLHNQTPEDFRVSLMVSELDASAHVAYDVAWDVLPRDASGSTEWFRAGVRVYLGGQPRWVSLEPGPWETSATLPDGSAINGSISITDPPVIEWVLPRTATRAVTNDALSSFGATTWAVAPTTGQRLTSHDTTRPDASEGVFLIFDYRPVEIAITGFTPPTRPADLTDPAGDVSPAADLLGFWWDLDGDRLNVTTSLGNFSASIFETCDWVNQVYIRSYRGNNYDTLQLMRQYDLRPGKSPGYTESNQSSNEGRLPVEFLLVEGTPGFVRYSMKADVWQGSRNLRSLNIDVDTQCTPDEDRLSFEPNSVPGPSSVLVLAAATALAWARRRKL